MLVRAHLHSGLTPARIHRAFLIAALPVAVAAVVLFGRRAALLMFLSAAGALLGEMFVRWIVRRGRRFELEHAALMGLLLAFTLPVTVAWYVPLVGGFVAVAVGKGLLGGLGNYLWHPALVGWAVLHIWFAPQLAPEKLPFLAKGHLVSGDIRAASDSPTYRGFELSPPPPGVHAWLRPRPLDALLPWRAPHPSGVGDGSPVIPGHQDRSLAATFRDDLPPWSDTVWGPVGGGIGETCTIAILLGGLYLIHRGLARWQSPLAAIVAVAALTAVLPIQLEASSSVPQWFPILQIQDGFPVGFAVLLFQITGDGMLLAAFILAADPPTTPLTARGHLLFGLGLGVLTMAARLLGLTPGSAYWAVLTMNTLVPILDSISNKSRTR